MKFPFSYAKPRQICIAVLGLLVPFFSLPCFANESLTIATWNVGFIDRSVNDLNIDGFLNEVNFDILLVDEIKTQSDLDALKEAMGREEYFTAISSFVNGNRNLEVAIISRFPLANVVEFDRSPDNAGGAITERRLEAVDLPGIESRDVERGFLVVEVPELKLFVIASHFKSSRGASGQADLVNAQQRELVAAAVATHVVELLAEYPGYTVVFGGDVNVGVTDSTKNGTSLTDDINEGYDETHALLGGGLINGLRMRSLAQDVDSTYVGDDNIPDFPGTGAIDVLYVAGPLADDFNAARATSDRYGSDHLAVFATTGDGSGPTDGGSSGSEEGSVIITNALPNPDGPDIGQEQVTLSYSGQGVIDISGWFMQDESGSTFTFPAGSVLNSGENEFTLRVNTMPLNNTGDTITLFNKNRVQQGPVFSYSRAEVVSGQRVR